LSQLSTLTYNAITSSKPCIIMLFYLHQLFPFYNNYTTVMKDVIVILYVYDVASICSSNTGCHVEQTS